MIKIRIIVMLMRIVMIALTTMSILITIRIMTMNDRKKTLINKSHTTSK